MIFIFNVLQKTVSWEYPKIIEADPEPSNQSYKSDDGIINNLYFKYNTFHQLL